MVEKEQSKRYKKRDVRVWRVLSFNTDSNNQLGLVPKWHYTSLLRTRKYRRLTSTDFVGWFWGLEGRRKKDVTEDHFGLNCLRMGSLLCIFVAF